MSTPESTIIERVLRGDTEGYGQLVERHQDQVFGVLRRLVQDQETAEDLAQTAFLKAFEGLGDFRRTASFATWVTQIAIHLARDHHRRRMRAPVVSIEGTAAYPAQAEDIPSLGSDSDPLENAIADDLQTRLNRAIATLPVDYREVFVLRHLEEQSYEEIATLTGVSVGALKVRNHRARRWLLDQLAQEEQPPVLRLHRQ